MAVRAKFKVNAITQKEHWDKTKGPLVSIHLAPVVSNSLENTAFYAATPCGEIKLDTLNAEAGNQFVLGGEYYVDFTAAPLV